MTTPAPTKTLGSLLYAGPAGKVWAGGVELYGLTAHGVTVQGVTLGGPTNQPTPAEMQAVQTAAQTAYGPLKPWMVFAACFAVLVVPALLKVPVWLTVLLGFILLGVALVVPVARQAAMGQLRRGRGK